MVFIVGGSPPPSSHAFFSCQRSLSLPRLAWSSTLIPPPRRKNVEAERCGDFDVPLSDGGGGGGILDSSGVVVDDGDPFEEEEEEAEHIFRHERISAADRCTRQGRTMFALVWCFSSALRIHSLFRPPESNARSLTPSPGRLGAH